MDDHKQKSSLKSSPARG